MDSSAEIDRGRLPIAVGKVGSALASCLISFLTASSFLIELLLTGVGDGGSSSIGKGFQHNHNVTSFLFPTGLML
jgi:hypothetical protein